MGLDARAYLEKHGEDHCRKLAHSAGTTMGYFLQIAYRARRPGPDLALTLHRRSRGRELDLILLLRPPLPVKRPRKVQRLALRSAS